MLLAFGAGLLPLMAGSAKAALAKVPTDGADTLLMLMGSALVLLMTPGLAFFYGGFTRAKNVLNTMMMSFFLMGLIGVLWVVVGYSLAFDGGFKSPFIGGLGSMWMNGVGGEFGDAPLADGFNLSASSFALFQGMFAIITPALISGAIVERVSFKAWFWFCVIWSLLIYSPMAKMVWGGGFLGPFGSIGAIDFAGGTVVHIASGVAALVAAAIIGERTTWPDSKRPPHNVPFILLGAGLLWFGWFGFNAGSALGAGALATSAFVVTHIASAAAGLTWSLIEWIRHGRPTVLGIITGAVAGLVAITPASGFVTPISAIWIGIGASVLCYLAAVIMKAKLGYDDTLDAFGVHGIGGIWGAIATGLFATKTVNAAGADGLFYGNPAQLWIQVKVTLVTVAWAFVMSFVLLKIVNALMGARADEHEERVGLDLTGHRESAYTVLD